MDLSCIHLLIVAVSVGSVYLQNAGIPVCPTHFIHAYFSKKKLQADIWEPLHTRVYLQGKVPDIAYWADSSTSLQVELNSCMMNVCLH